MTVADRSAPERPSILARARTGLTRALQALEALPFYAFMGLFRTLGPDRASAWGGAIGRTLGPLIPVHRVGRRNLKAALGLDGADAARVLRSTWENLGRTAGEYAHFGAYSGFPNPRIEVVGLENAKAALAAGKGAILVSGHFANWELMALGAHHAGLTGAEVYRIANNPFVNDWIVARRRRFAYPLQVPKSRDGTRDLVKTLREGGSVAMLADQKYHEGLAIPFFGRDAMTAAGPAVLALRMGSAIVPVSMERLRENGRMTARFRLTFHPALDVARTGDKDADVRAILLAINAFLEAQVRARPDEWLWFHRRWPPA